MKNIKKKLNQKILDVNLPEDYCQHRQSCLIHFMEQEDSRESEKKVKGKIEIWKMIIAMEIMELHLEHGRQSNEEHKKTLR